MLLSVLVKEFYSALRALHGGGGAILDVLLKRIPIYLLALAVEGALQPVLLALPVHVRL